MSELYGRPCEVNSVKAFFHCWEQYSEIIEPSFLKGGHSGGQISMVFGIVEFENGRVERIHPREIKFVTGCEYFRKKINK